MVYTCQVNLHKFKYDMQDLLILNLLLSVKNIILNITPVLHNK